MSACKGDSASAGSAVLDENDAIIVLADTFELSTKVEPFQSILSQPDSFLLGEIETGYGLMQASILTQLACPEGYHYPENAVVDSVCLFMYYASWVGDGNAPMAINAYLMDKKTLGYRNEYTTDIDISEYCSGEKSILTHHRITVASEKLDSIRDSNGKYIPMLRMRLNDDFSQMFGSIRSFESQAQFNEQFKGLVIESSFGSSTVLNVSDIALGVYYHFSYSKAGKDTIVDDMKAFYANSEVRTVNHIEYLDKDEWVENMRSDSLTHSYIVAPAGVYTRIVIPQKQLVEKVKNRLAEKTAYEVGKRPYMNMAQIKVEVYNYDDPIVSYKKEREDWLKPATNMLLIKESSKERFFENLELPSDTCALLASLTQETDSLGLDCYCYKFDLSTLLTQQIRRYDNGEEIEENLSMLLVPVTVTTSTANNSITRVKEQQTISATLINSAWYGLELNTVYSGF